MRRRTMHRARLFTLSILSVALLGRSVSAQTRAEVEEVEEVEEIEEVEMVEDGEAAPGTVLADEFDGDNAIRRDRGVNILTARPLRSQSFQLIIDHRAFENFWAGEDAFFNFLGLDGGGLKIGLGLRYGIIDDLDVGFYRLNDAGLDFFDTYEFDARWRFLKQEKHFVDAAVHLAYTWFVQPDTKDASGIGAELFVNRIFFGTLLIGAGFSFHSESSNDEKAQDDKGYSGAVTGVIEWRILRWLGITGEIAARVLGYGSEYPAFSLGLKLLTHRHSFLLLVSNAQYTTTDGIVTNSWRGMADLIFGFQIIREFNLDFD